MVVDIEIIMNIYVMTHFEIKDQKITPSESLSMRQNASQNSAIWSFVNLCDIICCYNFKWINERFIIVQKGYFPMKRCENKIYVLWCCLIWVLRHFAFIDVWVGIVDTRLMGNFQFKRQQFFQKYLLLKVRTFQCGFSLVLTMSHSSVFNLLINKRGKLNGTVHRWRLGWTFTSFGPCWTNKITC